MAKKFHDLLGKVTPKERAYIDTRKAAMLVEASLTEVRKNRSVSQEDLAQTMDVPQSAISKMERRTDAKVSTLRRYVESMGGDLRIIASFSNGVQYDLTQFSGAPHRPPAKRKTAKRKA